MTPSFSGRIALIVPGRAAEHPLRLEPDGVDVARRLVDRHHRGLAEHDAAPAHVDERVGRAEIDRHVAAAEPGDVVEDAHVDPRLTLPALALALASAALHAAWNLLLARARDVQAAAAATFLLSVVLAAPLAAVFWSAEPSVWPYALASTLLETVYVVRARLRLPAQRPLARLPGHTGPRPGPDPGRDRRRCSAAPSRRPRWPGSCSSRPASCSSAARRGASTRGRSSRSRRSRRRSPPTRSSTAPGSSTRAPSPTSSSSSPGPRFVYPPVDRPPGGPRGARAGKSRGRGGQPGLVRARPARAAARRGRTRARRPLDLDRDRGAPRRPRPRRAGAATAPRGRRVVFGGVALLAL